MIRVRGNKGLVGGNMEVRRETILSPTMENYLHTDSLLSPTFENMQ